MFIHWEEKFPSAAHTLLEVWLLPLRDPTAEERRDAYERCAEILKVHLMRGNGTVQRGYGAVLLDRLATDEKASAALAADVLSTLTPSKIITSLNEDLACCLVRCALAFLGRDRDSDQRIANTLRVILPHCHPEDILAVEAWVRLTEMDLPVPSLAPFDEWNESMFQKIANRRPDLVERLRRLTK